MKTARILPLILVTLFIYPLFLQGDSERFHPGIRWKEISDSHFVVVFPKGYDEEAYYTIQTAHELFHRLEKLWNDSTKIHGKIRILLNDSADYSNGIATFYPYNQIEIFLFTPPPDSQIGSGKDWIRMVLSHELSHLYQYNAGSGLTYFLRNLVGSNPVLYPIVYMPDWMMEGLAVYSESKTNSGGRLNTPDYKIMMREISRAGKIPPWKKIMGNPTPWPGLTAKYLYGSAFTEYLVEKYGLQKVQELVHSFAYYPIPFTLKPGFKPHLITLRQRFKLTFKKGITALWREFLQYHSGQASKSAPPIDKKVDFLDRDGFYNQNPFFADGKKILYIKHNLSEYPGIYQLDRVPGQKKRLYKKSGISTCFFNEKENIIYFSAADYWRSFYDYSDIYRLDLNSGLVDRLTGGSRLSYPVQFHDSDKGDKIICVKRINSRSHLAEFDLKTREEKVISTGFESIAFLSVSPDDRYIAASIKQKNEEWGIGLFTREGEWIKNLTAGHEKSYYPVWKSATDIYFICRDSDRYRLASINTEEGNIRLYTDPLLPDFLHFCLTDQPGKIVGAVFDANGINLGLVDMPGIEDTRILPVTASPTKAGKDLSPGYSSGVEPGTAKPKVKAYRFLRELAPKYISGTFRNAGNEYQPGIYLSSSDLPRRNSFTLSTYYSFKMRKPGIYFNYTFNGLYPSLSLRYSNLSDYDRHSEMGTFYHNEKTIEGELLFPMFIRKKYRSHFLAGLHFEKDMDEYLELPQPQENRYIFNGIKLGYMHSSVKRYYDAFSNSDGLSLAFAYSRDFRFLGSSFNINTIAMEYRHYISLWRPNVIAIRLGMVNSWGESRRIFRMGGPELNDSSTIPGNNVLKLMRGYPSGHISGTGGFLMNFEYRLSLAKVENVFLVLRSIERFYLSLFVDIGNTWNKKITFDPLISPGIEMTAIALLGDYRFYLSAGAAFAQKPYRSPLFYIRLGNSF